MFFSILLKELQMSNDLALFSNNLPDYLKEVGLDDMTKALAGNTGMKRISIRGGVFRMMVSGEEIAKNENRSMNIVIVNGATKVSRSFYAGKYVAGETSHPDCWSNDGEKPDASCKEPQHNTCTGCPQDINGSGQGSTKACRKNRRIAVALASDLDGDVYQMTLQSKSIFYDMKDPGDLEHMPFNQYAKYVGTQGYNLNTLVTEMRFDEDSTVGKLFFRPVRFLEKHEWEKAVEQGETTAAKNAITMTVAQTDGLKKLAAPAAAPVAAKAEAEVAEPTKRAEKKADSKVKPDLKSVLGDWSTDDEA